MARAAFKGGVHPPTHKEATRALEIQRAPVPERVAIPMSQHLGAPCEPTVGRKEHVSRGDVVGDVDALISAPAHASVSGEVAAIGSVRLASGQNATTVEIVPDEDQDLDVWAPIEVDGDVPATVRRGGIVGMGGAAFPSPVKLMPPKDMPVHTVILNGCECEPYLTCDDRTMRERASEVVAGARLMREAVGAKRLVIGVEDNKPEALDALRAAADDGIEVLSLPTSYPQGAEKQLIYSVTGDEVPHGKLPAATGCLVHNVGTAAAMADAVERSKPLIERVVTVTGAVVRPGNYLTLIGTPIGDLIDAAGGLTSEAARVIAGGPMTGMGVANLAAPVVKGTSGVVALSADVVPPAVTGDQPCIRCGRCADACPMLLQPFSLGIQANAGHWDWAEEGHVLDCIECGCCSYACPTRRPLIQLLRRAKQVLLDRGAKL